MKKKIIKFICSMKCAIILLLILALACTAGSLIPQGESAAYYTGSYSSTLAGAILLLGLHDIFHCWWFVGLTLFLCINLLGCNVLRFPELIRRMKQGFSLEKCLTSWDGKPTVKLEGNPEPLFAGLGFRKVEKTTINDKQCFYACRNKIGIWGAWLCHLGMLVIIAGFGLGQMLKTEYTVYGVPGQTKAIGDTGYNLTIDDFDVLLREDATVEQYTSKLTLSKGDGDQTSYWGGEASVNSPLSLQGMKFYQNSTGWAATLEIWKGETKQQEVVLCAGEHALVEGQEDLAVMLNAFYPDYYEDENGLPMTLTPVLKNPGYLYTLYYQNRVLGMNVLTGTDVITVEDYTFIFRDPQQYTLIQVKRDPFTPLAAVGGLLVLAALILAFYVRTEELWAVQEEKGIWMVSGKSKKGGAMFQDEIARKAGLLKSAKQKEER